MSLQKRSLEYTAFYRTWKILMHVPSERSAAAISWESLTSVSHSSIVSCSIIRVATAAAAAAAVTINCNVVDNSYMLTHTSWNIMRIMFYHILYANSKTLCGMHKITIDSSLAMAFTYVVHNAHAWVTLKNNLLTYLFNILC